MPNSSLVAWEYCTGEGGLSLSHILSTAYSGLYEEFEILVFLQMPVATAPLAIGHWNKM